MPYGPGSPAIACCTPCALPTSPVAWLPQGGHAWQPLLQLQGDENAATIHPVSDRAGETPASESMPVVLAGGCSRGDRARQRHMLIRHQGPGAVGDRMLSGSASALGRVASAPYKAPAVNPGPIPSPACFPKKVAAARLTREAEQAAHVPCCVRSPPGRACLQHPVFSTLDVQRAESNSPPSPRRALPCLQKLSKPHQDPLPGPGQNCRD